MSGQLANISQVLGATLPGNQSLTLTVFVAPPTGEDETQQRSRHCFLELEPPLGALPFLNAVLVYQWPLELYRRSSEDEQRLQTAVALPDLLELLVRESGDADLVAIVQRLGYPTVRDRQQVAGRKAGYSALGAQRLIYLREATLEHLEARFQQALCQQGLLDPNHAFPVAAGFPGRAGPALAAGVRAGIYRVLRQCAGNGSQSARRSSGVRRKADRRSAFSKKNSTRPGKGLEQRLEPVPLLLEQQFREALDSVLADSHGYLAGGRFYLAALAAGLDELQKTRCQQPFAAGVSACYAGWIPELSRHCGMAAPATLPNAEPGATVAAAVAAFQAVTADAGAERSAPVRFFTASWDCLNAYLQQALPEVAAAWQLLMTTGEQFFVAAGELAAQVQENQQLQHATREAIAALYDRYPWYRRRFFQRAAFLKEQQALGTRLAALEQAHAAYLTCLWGVAAVLSGTGRWTQLWPNLVRLLIMAGLRRRPATLTVEFEAFCTAVATACAERWQPAAAVPEVDRWTATTVVTAARLDTLYGEVVGFTPWLEWARQALAFLPAGVLDPAQLPAYRHCQTLRDHWHADPALLVQRLADFAAVWFAPVRRLDALDLIELSGLEQAEVFLRQMLAKTERLPEFASGWLPLVAQHHLPRRVRVIRCTRRIQDRLCSQYGHLFGANECFLEVETAEMIDLTTFNFGFPAFLLHALHAVQSVTLAAGESLADNLGPVPASQS